MKRNGRTAAQDAAIIKERIADINKSLGTKYFADNDGVYGWTMYEVKENGALSHNDLGFSDAKSIGEMYAYTEAIMAMLRLLKSRKISL